MEIEIISRRAARFEGRKRFYTGHVCKYGHDSERYTSTGGCISCLDPTWRQVKAQIGEDILKIIVRIPATMTYERRGALARWIQDSCVPAFLNPPQS
jgi:hypothetical protein